MRLFAIGHNHRTAGIDMRERCAIETGRLPPFLADLRAASALDEVVVLSTCNRFEIYALGDRDAELVVSAACRLQGLDPAEVRPRWYVHEDIEACRHLCRVASGLDSLVLGEPQILGQLKDAYAAAASTGTAGDHLRRLFGKTFAIAKKVRTRTGIGRSPVSVSSAAVDLARQSVGDLADCCALMIGAGRMGELAVRNLRTYGARELLIANRTFSKAVELAERLKAVPIMFHELPEYLERADVVIVSVGATAYVLGPDQIIPGLPRRHKPGPFIIDISVPRAVDPSVQHLPGVRLCNIDDLSRVVADNGERRRDECAKALRIIDEEAPGMLQAAAASRVAPVVASMRVHAEQTRQAMCAEIASDGNALTPAQVDAATRRLVGRIMHETTKLLRQFAAGDAPVVPPSDMGNSESTPS